MITVTINLRAMLENTRDILEFYAERYGDESLPKLVIDICQAIESPDDAVSFAFDQENDAAIFKMLFG